MGQRSVELLLVLFQSMLKPEGLATKLQDVRLIGEPVQQPGGKPFIAKHMKLVQPTKYLDCDIILFLSGMV